MSGASAERPFRFLSLFSGIEAASVAWHPLGWECAGVAEVEPFPCAVLAHHYPKVPNLGDVTKITEEHINQLGPIDLVVGGFPCQDLSVAGKRKGLTHADGTVTRSGLFFTGMQIFHWAREHCGARFLLVENVPGLFSSNKGRDFAAVVGHMAGLEDVPVPRHGWGSEGVAVGDHGMLEWCVLDAQWRGLAQRRKRVFALLDTGDWAGRPPVLLEPEGMRGDSPPSREAGKASPDEAGSSIAGCWWDGGQVSQTLDAVLPKGQTMPEKNRFPAVLTPVAIPINMQAAAKNGAKSPNMLGVGEDGDPFPTLGANDVHAVAYDLISSSASRDTIADAFAVRRITPEEAEALQGFPRNYTRIPWRGKPASVCPDGNRYKALGNSFAIPCIRWVGYRIERALGGEQ